MRRFSFEISGSSPLFWIECREARESARSSDGMLWLDISGAAQVVLCVSRSVIPMLTAARAGYMEKSNGGLACYPL